MIEVDIIIPVHNAERTLKNTLGSALNQLTIASNSDDDCPQQPIVIYVCCHDDASTDSSLDILREYETTRGLDTAIAPQEAIETHLVVSASPDGVSRGAGFARNRAVDLRRDTTADCCFLCMLDSDDEMKPHRVAEQVQFIMTTLKTDKERDRALLGTQFTRDPPDASWHYANWANTLSDERLYLERFREVTMIQPTWMMSRRRFQELGGYVEAPHPNEIRNGTPCATLLPSAVNDNADTSTSHFRLVHPTADSSQTLRLAEDLRFFYAHLESQGTLHLLRRELVVYKQVSDPLQQQPQQPSTSQSSQTSRRLLLQLRTFAFEQLVLRKSPEWQGHGGKFVVWGAGRDGKDFVKMLSHDMRQRVYCFADVDEKKIEQGYYINRQIDVKIPIVHFSSLVRDLQVKERIQSQWLLGDDAGDPGYGRVNKAKSGDTKAADDTMVPPPKKRQRKRSLHAVKGNEFDMTLLSQLPVVVCVALYRTGGALERNVASIGRIEGKNLWHLV